MLGLSKIPILFTTTVCNLLRFASALVVHSDLMVLLCIPGSAALGGAKGASAAAGQSPATPKQRLSGSFVSSGDLPDVPALLDRVFESICRPLQVPSCPIFTVD